MVELKHNPQIDFYREELDERIIARLAEVKDLTLDEAMDIYYRSRLSTQVSHGTFGIDNLDYKYLVDDLIENEPNLFS